MHFPTCFSDGLSVKFCNLPYLCPNVRENNGSVLEAGHDTLVQIILVQEKNVLANLCSEGYP